MVPDLPLELKCIVLQNLSCDKGALAACSTLSHAWQDPSQRLLFRSITLHATYIPTKPHHLYPRAQVPDYEAFLKVLPPHLLGSIHDLHLHGKPLPFCKEELDDLEEFYGYDDEEDGEAKEDEFYQPPEQEISWTALYADVLLRIVKALPGLKMLTLMDFVFKPVGVPNVSSLKLEKMVLRSLGTRGNVDPLRFFDVLGADEVVLDVFHRPMDEELGPMYLPAGLASATSLDISGEDVALRILQALQQHPPPLTSLTVHIRTVDEFRALHSLLQALTATIKTLFLDMYLCFSAAKPFVTMDRGCLATMESLDLSTLKGLTHFELGVRLGFAGGHTEETIRAMGPLLSTLPSSVTDVTLHLDFPFLLADLVDEIQSWPILQRVLREHNGLQRLELSITHSYDAAFHAIGETTHKELDLVLFTQFAALRDILSVTYQSHSRSASVCRSAS